jgi:uncharacterized OB-fold protein
VAAFRKDVPYAVALIELVEGPRLISGLTDVDLDHLRIGQDVEILFDDVDPEVTLHRFCPV